MKAKLGRPLSDNPKNIQMRIRFSEEEMQKLEYCCKELNLNKSEIIRKGIDMIYNNIQVAN